MKKFKFKAVNLEKKKFNGTYLAEDENDLNKKLSEQGLYLIYCKELKNSTPNSFFSLSGKVTSKELSSFCTQFSLLLDSSMEVISCLEILKSQQKNGYFRKVLEIVYEDVKVGVSLGKALEKHKKVFPNFVTSMAYVGEMSSSLNFVFKSLASYIESENKLKSKVKSALMYPSVILVLLFGIVILMMVFVIPTFRDSMSQMNVELPALTVTIYSISDFCVDNWIYLILGLIGFVLLIKLLISTKQGRYYFDKMKINLPFIGKIGKNLVMARLSRGLGLLLKSGMKLVESMEIAKKLAGNKFVEKRFEDAIVGVQSGKSLEDALSEMKIFPNVFLQMVAVAEKSATLDSGMFRIAEYYDEQASGTLSNIATIIQPFMLVIVGLIVAVIFMAVYSPIMSMMTDIA